MMRIVMGDSVGISINSVVAIALTLVAEIVAIRSSNFLSAPTQVKAYENTTIMLPCLHNSEPQFVRWYFEDNLIADSRDEQFPPNVHIWANGSLQVDDIKSGDTGDYACEVGSASGIDSQTHSIEVQYPPTIIASAKGMVEVTLGSTFEMVCEARGVPPPIISWTHNGKALTEPYKHTPRHLFHVTNVSMSGQVDCVASNGVGEPASTGILLVVQFAPRVEATKQFVHTKIGLQATLECEVTSYPTAKVYWFHRIAPVYPDSRITATESDSNPNRTTAYYQSRKKHILTIKNVREQDLGMYECKSENKIGLKSAHIELAGRPMPSIFKKSPVASSPTTHNLIWTTESFSPIIEYNLKFRQVISGNFGPDSKVDTRWKELTIPGDAGEGPLHSIGYIIKGLVPGKVYEAAVASRNRFGWSDISKVMHFHTGAEGQAVSYPVDSNATGDEDVETHYYDENIPEEASIISSSTTPTINQSITLVFALLQLKSHLF